MSERPTLNELVSTPSYDKAATQVAKTYVFLFFIFCGVIAYLDKPTLGWWWAVVLGVGLFASSILVALPMTYLKLLLATTGGLSPLSRGARVFYIALDFAGYGILWFVTRYAIHALSA